MRAPDMTDVGGVTVEVYDQLARVAPGELEGLLARDLTGAESSGWRHGLPAL